MKSKRLGLLRWFVKNGANINFQDPDGYSPLYWAVKREHNLALVRELLEYGADPNLKGNDGQTRVSLAVAKGKTKLAAILNNGG